MKKVGDIIFKVAFSLLSLTGMVVFFVLLVNSILKLLNLFSTEHASSLVMISRLVEPVGILVIGALLLDMGKTVFVQEIADEPEITETENENGEIEVKKKTFVSTLEKTSRFALRFLLIVIIVLVLHFTEIVFNYNAEKQNLIILTKAGLSIVGASVLLLIWAIYFKD